MFVVVVALARGPTPGGCCCSSSSSRAASTVSRLCDGAHSKRFVCSVRSSAASVQACLATQAAPRVCHDATPRDSPNGLVRCSAVAAAAACFVLFLAAAAKRSLLLLPFRESARLSRAFSYGRPAALASAASFHTFSDDCGAQLALTQQSPPRSAISFHYLRLV